MNRCLTSLLLIGSLAAVTPAAAQSGDTRRLGVDTVIGVQDLFAETRDWPTQIVADAFASYELKPGLQVSARPVLWRVGGEWEGLLDQLSVQYEFQRGSNWRIEVGRFPSPIGLGMTENRASVNPGLLWCHRPYYMPLPDLDAGAPLVSLVSAVYPTGVMVATSDAHWDARAAVVDTAPTRYWYAHDAEPRANVIVGGGITPRQGLRVGLASAWGEVSGAVPVPYRMVNVEAQYVTGYARISGEWTRGRFDAGGRLFVASGVTAQAQYGLSPRVFLHSRATMAWSESASGPQATLTHRFTSIDSTIGYRLSPEVTLRGGYNAVRSFSSDAVDHQIGASLMWVRRWW